MRGAGSQRLMGNLAAACTADGEAAGAAAAGKACDICRWIDGARSPPGKRERERDGKGEGGGVEYSMWKRRRLGGVRNLTVHLLDTDCCYRSY